MNTFSGKRSLNVCNFLFIYLTIMFKQNFQKWLKFDQFANTSHKLFKICYVKKHHFVKCQNKSSRKGEMLQRA